MSEEPKILPPGATLLALPYVSKSGFDGATVSSIIYALINNGLPRVMFAFYQDSSAPHARNAAAAEAIRREAEWLFFVDSDADFPTNTLERLKALDADIACTDMWSRNWPSFRTVLEYGKPGRDGEKRFKPYKGGKKVRGAKDVDCCGMHCTLIKTSLLRKFAKDELMPFPMTNHGEDAAFCIVAKQKYGATIRCDFDIVSGHWGRARMVGQDFTRDARNQIGALIDPEFMRRMGARHVAERKA